MCDMHETLGGGFLMCKTKDNGTMRQRLIVVEGLDGSGKATQSQLLATWLKKKGAEIRAVSFPGYQSPSSSLVKMYLGGEFGSHPDDVNAYAASSFYAVDRFASYKKDWEADYKNGIVIADRYTTSNAIHQCSKLDKSEWDEYLAWLFHYEYELLGIPSPDIVIYLKVAPEVSQILLKRRYEGEDKRDIHEKDEVYLKKCQEAAAYCAEKLSWKVIECCEGGEMRSIESIQNSIQHIVNNVM